MQSYIFAELGSGRANCTGTKAEAIRDLEPEYISLSEDELTAYVALQENNAIAVDIAAKRIQSVKGLYICMGVVHSPSGMRPTCPRCTTAAVTLRRLRPSACRIISMPAMTKLIWTVARQERT